MFKCTVLKNLSYWTNLLSSVSAVYIKLSFKTFKRKKNLTFANAAILKTANLCIARTVQLQVKYSKYLINSFEYSVLITCLSRR